ncbi:MAG: hypothetical protein U0326_32720 [Polyangiales bacterium]
MLLRSVLVLALTAGCAATRPRVVGGPDTATVIAGDYSPDVRDEAKWRALAASPGRQVSAHTEVVKVIIDLEDGWKVYFLQSRRWEIHYFFASRFLSSFAHPVEDHGAFNVREYRRDDRRFILGTLTRYQDQNVWAYDLIAGDTLDVARTVRAFEAVRARVYFGDALRYRPVPPAHEAAVAEFTAAHVPLVTTQELFGATRFQPLNPGDAWGWLRFVEGDPDPSRVRRTDVVVLDHVPLDLPVCAGIITGELQAPLSHVAVLATNRGTPDMALRGAFTDPRLRALEGHLVRLRVTPQEWSVEAASQADAERAWERLRPRAAMIPPLSDRDTGLPDVNTLRYGDVATAGAKAAQLGELAAIGGAVVVPRAFALPFRAYLDHLRASGVDAMIRDARARQDFRDDPQVRDRTLAEVRQRIRAAPVDPAVIERMRARIGDVPRATRAAPVEHQRRGPARASTARGSAAPWWSRPIRLPPYWPTRCATCGRAPGRSRPTRSASSFASTTRASRWPCSRRSPSTTTWSTAWRSPRTPSTKGVRRCSSTRRWPAPRAAR